MSALEPLTSARQRQTSGLESLKSALEPQTSGLEPLRSALERQTSALERLSSGLERLKSTHLRLTTTASPPVSVLPQPEKPCFEAENAVFEPVGFLSVILPTCFRPGGPSVRVRTPDSSTIHQGRPGGPGANQKCHSSDFGSVPESPAFSPTAMQAVGTGHGRSAPVPSSAVIDP